MKVCVEHGVFMADGLFRPTFLPPINAKEEAILFKHMQDGVWYDFKKLQQWIAEGK